MKGQQMTRAMTGYEGELLHYEGVQVLEQRPTEVAKSHLGKLKSQMDDKESN